jgi:hypothetical protein
MDVLRNIIIKLSKRTEKLLDDKQSQIIQLLHLNS